RTVHARGRGAARRRGTLVPAQAGLRHRRTETPAASAAEVDGPKAYAGPGPRRVTGTDRLRLSRRALGPLRLATTVVRRLFLRPGRGGRQHVPPFGGRSPDHGDPWRRSRLFRAGVAWAFRAGHLPDGVARLCDTGDRAR